MSAISWNVSPWYSFRMMAVRCSSGRSAIARATAALISCRATRSSMDSLGVASDAISIRSIPSGAWATGWRRSRRTQSRHRFSAMR
jgi:hypothetical protein